jgi:hypothetical protein
VVKGFSAQAEPEFPPRFCPIGTPAAKKIEKKLDMWSSDIVRYISI